MSAHTAGPWRFDTDTLGTIQAELYGEVIGQAMQVRSRNQDLLSVERKANARLMAAAPELLAALTALYNGMDSCVELTPEVMRAARAAIAKATGSAS